MDVEATKLRVNAALPQILLTIFGLSALCLAAFAPNGDWCGAVGIASAALGGVAGLGKQSISK